MDPEAQKQLEFVADKPASELTADEAELIVQKHLDESTPQGVVVVEADNKVEIKVADFAADHVGDLAFGLLAALIAFSAVRLLLKPWWDFACAKFGFLPQLVRAVEYTSYFAAGAAVSLMMGFDAHWYSLTATVLDPISAIGLGGLLTGGAAAIIALIADGIPFVKTLEAKWYKIMRVSKEEIEKLRTVEMAGVVTGESDDGNEE